MASDDTSEEDRQHFLSEIEGTRPLVFDGAEPHRSKPRAVPRFTRMAEEQVMHDALHDPIEPDQVESGDELLFCRPGIQHGTFRKLRKGQFVVEAELDLHGLFVKEARVVLLDFLNQARAQGARCVRIIHGKGLRSRHKGPVLKTKVNAWLRQRDEVLAFASAMPKDGGTGAVYVLLKRG